MICPLEQGTHWHQLEKAWLRGALIAGPLPVRRVKAMARCELANNSTGCTA